MDVMGCHALRTSANLAAEGKFSEARTGAIASQRLMKRSLERSRLTMTNNVMHFQSHTWGDFNICRDRNTMKKASYNRTISSIAPLEKTLREKQLRVRSLYKVQEISLVIRLVYS